VQQQQIMSGSLWWGSVLALLIGSVTWFGASWLIRGLGLSDGSAVIAVDALTLTGFGMWILMARLVAGALYRGMGDGQTPLRVGVVVNLLNAVIGHFFMFGVADWSGMGGECVGDARSACCRRHLVMARFMEKDGYDALR
jgi:Na+-driven multidrug efflux pump